MVLFITIGREAVEEIRCSIRDKEVNSHIYSKLLPRGKSTNIMDCYTLLYHNYQRLIYALGAVLFSQML